MEAVIHGFEIKMSRRKEDFLPGGEKMMRATLASQRSKSSLAFFNSPILPLEKVSQRFTGAIIYLAFM
ncbi:hypothetical protein SUGI_0206120 [Cryptomeria japonica]|nr:hypothetical protein SUGI_0206120 [Cryptomeria japonica]